MLFVKVLITGHRRGSRLGAATERVDRRMNCLIEAYQGILAGTRIATEGFAMETAGLGCPMLLGLDVVERPACEIASNPGQAARGLQPRYMELSRESPGRDFDHA
jgi:hypothetical protein